MPIKPENRKRYPANWKEIRAAILLRAGNRCEFCGIPNYTVRENGSKVVLTIAHLDHTPENNDPSNLRALCQKCHNTYDASHRAETRRNSKLAESLRKRAQMKFDLAHEIGDPMLHEAGLRLIDRAIELEEGGRK